MATQGVPIDQLDQEDQDRARAMEQAHLGFLQTLPGDAVIVEEGVYATRVEQRRVQFLRERDEVGVLDTAEAPVGDRSPRRNRDGTFAPTDESGGDAEEGNGNE